MQPSLANVTRVSQPLAAAAIALVLAAGCTQSAGPTPPPTSATSSAAPAAATVVSPLPTAGATAAPATGNQRTVTLDDNGATVTLPVGEWIVLALDDGYTWQIEVSDESVVSQLSDVVAKPGAQGVFVGVNPGTATLSAAGDPLCRQSKLPCAMPSLAFRVTVVVD
ncbi:MAG: protease inhibitor I42 family protein [Caldilineales bacterium]